MTRTENGADAKQSTIDRLRRALEAAGIEFIEENGGGPGVRLRKREKKNREAIHSEDCKRTDLVAVLEQFTGKSKAFLFL